MYSNTKHKTDIKYTTHHTSNRTISRYIFATFGKQFTSIYRFTCIRDYLIAGLFNCTRLINVEICTRRMIFANTLQYR